MPSGGGIGTLDEFTGVADIQPSFAPSGKVVEFAAISSLKPGKEGNSIETSCGPAKTAFSVSSFTR